MTTRHHYMRPSGPVGPEGITDEQIWEMAMAMAEALIPDDEADDEEPDSTEEA